MSKNQFIHNEDLLFFASKILERYFENPKNERFWRQQLEIKWLEENVLWFGNLYSNGGTSVKIFIDSEKSYSIRTYHLPSDTSEKIKNEFKSFIVEKFRK
ncbi:hypothetical protein M3181_22120 [Mesobacillus maritimus]|uniref:hypothetical protein n=1 Tax=Mesobacillus maritimus TaxID=1643336 RepID=UPI00203E907F|nr:hypothetical protein [Mesobacillus maritimus]MCM3671656.1 hypothetical protein [Mesobacillus maritimus]